MAMKYKVTYLDGRQEEIFPSPRARIETEQHFGGLQMSNAQQASFYLAWKSLQKAGKTSEEFDPWLDSVMDLDEVEAADVRPTPPVQPEGTSSA